MKMLFLVRHAKSSWDDVSLSDKDRPLNDRGKRDAPKMGERLAKRGVQPDLILSSPAVRARTTAEIVAKPLGYNRKDIVVDDRLYATTADNLLYTIEELDDKFACVMLFGHNPELTELAQRLSHGVGVIEHMPTCAVAEFTFDIDSWAKVSMTKPKKVSLESPKKAAD
jgi:phosphohistidine phosphatase